MKVWDILYLWIISCYGDSAHLFCSKVGGILCSYADILVIWMFIRVVDEIKGHSPSYIRFRLLLFFLVITPILLLSRNSTQFFMFQFFVLGVPYLILAYSVITDIRTLMEYIRSKTQKQ